MSRFKRFAHSLVSGYVLLGANTLFTLASVPLALAYLSQAEWGLWALTSTIAGYVSLIDLGMSGSVARILIDHKDQRKAGRYGSVIKIGALVGTVQGLLILSLGTGLAFLMRPLLHIPDILGPQFIWLMIGQSALLAVSFATRIFNHLLTAHQRYDIINYALVALFGVNYALQWILFKHGFGVYSVLWAQVPATVLMVVINWLVCIRLKLLPGQDEWGSASWTEFKELFAFGRDIFLFVLGSQLISASQMLLLTRFFGLETATVWSICTRIYSLLLQIIYRIFDYSSSAIAEMIVRGEKALVAMRFRQIVILSTSLSIAAAVELALCNTAFVQVWTGGKVSWPPVNDLLLAVWLLICASLHLHIGLVGQTKQFKVLRYVFFVEGLAFVFGTIALQKAGGVTSMILISIACSLVFSFSYGLMRTKKYFGLAWSELAGWHREPLKLATWLVPSAIAAWWFTKPLPPAGRLLAAGVPVGLMAAWLTLKYGLGQTLQAEVARRMPVRVRSLFVRICSLRPLP